MAPHSPRGSSPTTPFTRCFVRGCTTAHVQVRTMGLGARMSLRASRTCMRPGGRPVAESTPPRVSGWASRDTPRLCLFPAPQAPARRCACALALVCLALLLLLLEPRGALGEELQPQETPGPRAAHWMSNLGHFNKYLEKLFNSRWWGRAGGREGGREDEQRGRGGKGHHRAPHPPPSPPHNLCKDVFPSLKSKDTKKSKHPKKSANTTKTPPANTVNPPQQTIGKPQPPPSSQGPR